MKNVLNKKVLSEYEKTYIVFDIMLYSLIAVVGYLLLSISNLEGLDPVSYSVPLFFIFGFLSLIAYFSNRRKGDYEFLIFGLINVVCASYIAFYSSYSNEGLIIGNAILVYTIANILNKGYHCKLLLEEKNIIFIPKIAVTILLSILGVLVVTVIYDIVDQGALILGEYFILYGLLSLLEPLLICLFKASTLEDKCNKLLGINKKEEAKEVKKEEKTTVKKEVNKKVEKIAVKKEIKPKINTTNNKKRNNTSNKTIKKTSKSTKKKTK